MNLADLDLNEEQNYLNISLAEIRNQISELGQDLYTKKEKLSEFQKFMWDSKHDMDPTEMKTMINASDVEVSLLTNKSMHLQKLYKIQGNPYFGSITFKSENINNKLYIGITHVEEEETGKYLIYDWRAPICSMFYDYEVGPASYVAPEGLIKGEITNKRQFNIKDGQIVRVFDNNLNIDDEMLQEILSKESSDKMKNIVNTIQQEQNNIIRNVIDKNLIVQGIAGSGKTSVALHRIAFLLYKIKNLNSQNVLIFSPNQVFTEYISNVLPELGEDNTLQTTFSEFLNSQLLEFKEVETFTSFIERFYKYNEKNIELVSYKQSDIIINNINEYIGNFLEDIQFCNGIDTHDFSVSKGELNYLLKDRFSKSLFMDRLDNIAEKLCRDYFEGKKSKKSSIISLLKQNLNKNIKYKEIYKDFFKSNSFMKGYKGIITQNEIDSSVSKRTIKYEDACLLVYLKSLLEGFSYKGLIREIVIDEAQDYNRLQYIIIRNIFKRSDFTILGDVNQTINPYYKYESLSSLCEIFDYSSIYLELSKTYRSSPEIIKYANEILGLSHVSAIRRDNNVPVLFRKDDGNLKQMLINDINKLKQNNNSIAIITKTDDEVMVLYDILQDNFENISMISSTTKEFQKDLVIIPAYIAKGLEFDSVIIYTNKDNVYKVEERYLYYVACTRCQHELIIYNQ